MELETWRELDEGVYVRSYAEQVLNVGLVVGEARCLVIDTRSSHVQGRELAAAVREVTNWTKSSSGHRRPLIHRGGLRAATPVQDRSRSDRSALVLVGQQDTDGRVWVGGATISRVEGNLHS